MTTTHLTNFFAMQSLKKFQYLLSCACNYNKLQISCLNLITGLSLGKVWSGVNFQNLYSVRAETELKVCMGLVFGNSSGRVGRVFIGPTVSRQAMALLLIFGMTLGVMGHHCGSFDLLGGYYYQGISFVRLIYDWEMVSFASFMNVLYMVLIRQSGADILFQNPSSPNVFEVRSYYKILHSTFHFSFPWRSLWKPKVPSKVSFFIWTSTLGRILTFDNLRVRLDRTYFAEIEN